MIEYRAGMQHIFFFFFLEKKKKFGLITFRWDF